MTAAEHGPACAPWCAYEHMQLVLGQIEGAR